MSYSIDANLLLYASDSGSGFHGKAHQFIESRAKDPDLLCLTWPAVMAYLRIATHPRIFSNPLSPERAWRNVSTLIQLPRTRMISEQEGFRDAFQEVSGGMVVRGNLVPDAHIAAILFQHGVRTIYTADADFRRFEFIKVINPLRNRV